MMMIAPNSRARKEGKERRMFVHQTILYYQRLATSNSNQHENKLKEVHLISKISRVGKNYGLKNQK